MPRPEPLKRTKHGITYNYHLRFFEVLLTKHFKNTVYTVQNYNKK